MHDDVRERSDRGRSWWACSSDSSDTGWDATAMAIGIALGGPLGLALGDPTLMAAGIAMGSGVGWGIGREIRAARDQPGQPVIQVAAGVGIGAAVIGLTAAWLTGWPVFVLLGIALGAAIGAGAARRLAVSRNRQ